MKRKLVLMLTLTLLIGILSVAFDVQEANASGTIYIRADGSIDPPDAPISTLDNVTYTLTGNIASDADGIVVERSTITIDGAGYTVEGTGIRSGGRGFFLSGITNVTIKNANIKQFWAGIWLQNSNNNTISGDNITNNTEYGISIFWGSSNNIISGNNIANNKHGIYLYSSSNNILRDNAMVNNAYNFCVTDHFVNDVDSSNRVNGKPIYYWVNMQDLSVPLDAGYVALVNCTNITAENLSLMNNGQAILLVHTTNSTITQNNVTNIEDGIYLYDSSNNNIIYGNSIITNTSDGIHLEYSSNNNIHGNNITAKWVGIYLDHSSNNTISGNNAKADNPNGIYLTYSSNNIICGNNIQASSGYYGIALENSSKNNAIYGNNIANTGAGVWFYSSSNNVVYHNNFINNNISQAYSVGSVNVWDDGYPSGGNYWSNYTGIDSNVDGIGDSNYTIDADNNDRYPLMGMFTEFNATLEQHIQTICHSTISVFDFNGTAMSFNVSGDNGTAGFCRICIPTALMNATYKVFVNGTEVSHNLLPCSNETYSYVYFNYTHSTQEVIIIPEFPSFLILPLFMIASLLAVIAFRRKRAKLI